MIFVIPFLFSFILIFKVFRNYMVLSEKIILSMTTFIGFIGVLSFFVDIKAEIFNNTVLFLMLLISLCLIVFKQSHYKKAIKLKASKKATFALISFSLLVLMFNNNLPIRGWDTYSLYDSRAKMILNGDNFNQFKNLSRFDKFNQLYYYSYPPMTSMLHLVSYRLNVNPMILYGFFYISLVFSIYFFLKQSALPSWAKLLLFLSSSLTPIITKQLLIAYTNLPYLTFYSWAIIIILTSKKKQWGSILVGGLMIAFSVWVRSLEPFYLLILLIGIYTILSKTKTNRINQILITTLFACISLSTKIIWWYYTSTQVGNLGYTPHSLSDLFFSFSSGLYISNILEVVSLVFGLLEAYKLYIAMIILSAIYYFLFSSKRASAEKFKMASFLFIGQLSVVFLGAFYFSTQFTWWNLITGSVIRSNMTLPIISIIIITYSGILQTKNKP